MQKTLQPCPKCGRTFAPHRLPGHVKICKQVPADQENGEEVLDLNVPKMLLINASGWRAGPCSGDGRSTQRRRSWSQMADGHVLHLRTRVRHAFHRHSRTAVPSKVAVLQRQISGQSKTAGTDTQVVNRRIDSTSSPRLLFGSVCALAALLQLRFVDLLSHSPRKCLVNYDNNRCRWWCTLLTGPILDPLTVLWPHSNIPASQNENYPRNQLF